MSALCMLTFKSLLPNCTYPSDDFGILCKLQESLNVGSWATGTSCFYTFISLFLTLLYNISIFNLLINICLAIDYM